MSDFSKNVLAIDCALGGCLVAVKVAASDRIVSQTYLTEREQAARLVPMVQDVMREAGVGFEDLELIVTTIGPGSFTGLRIGLSTARAFGMARDIPVQGVGTLECMVRSCALSYDRNAYLAVLETKRTDFYVAAFDQDGRALIEPCCMSADEVLSAVQGKNYIACGDGVERLIATTGREVFSDVRERSILDPEALLKCGVSRFIEVGGVAGKPEPLYLRGADVSMSNKTQREIKEIP